MEAPRAFDPYLNPFALPLFPPPLPPLANPTMESSTTKKKVRIQWLEDNAQRRSTFKKRRQGIIKKIEELHILCGVRTCAVIYGPGETNPEVWPGREEAAATCRSFKELPEAERLKMMRTHARFLQEMVGKKSQQLWHQHDEIVELQTRCNVYVGLMGADLRWVGREGLVRMHAMIRGMLRERYERCKGLRGRGQAGGDTVRGSPMGEAPMEALVDRFLHG